jgi:hypothetical protein
MECLNGTNDFIVPPKVFGCTCFVHDYSGSIGKLDPRAIKCIFVGYSPSQKGYHCWSPAEWRFFMSMDVTFHEDEPLYSLNVPNYGIDSKGEDSNKYNASGGSVLAPLMDICQPENGTQGGEVKVLMKEMAIQQIMRQTAFRLINK